WQAVAVWRWTVEDDVCGICRNPFDACCPDCKMPGDDCALVRGECKHCFHIHCIYKWIRSDQNPDQQCPMDRRPWGTSACTNGVDTW
ncbi:anaphase-promoting complex subunit 11, partial [Thamnocephalis sphaerospora]